MRKATGPSIITILLLLGCHCNNALNRILCQGFLRVLNTIRAGVAYGVYADNGYALITNNDDLLIFDVTDPNNPERLGGIATGTAFGATVIDNLVITVGDLGLKVIDITQKTNPLLLGTCPYQGVGHAVHVEATLAYIATSSGLEIINISDPASPVSIGHYSTGDAWGIAFFENVVYLANRINGLEVIDVTDPDSPQRIGTVPGTPTAWDAHRHEDLLYVACHQNGIRISTLADKESPQVIGIHNDYDGGESLAVWGDRDFLYVADNFGIELLDIHDPTNPQEIGECLEVNGAHDIFVHNKLVYIAEGMHGMIILEHTP